MNLNCSSIAFELQENLRRDAGLSRNLLKESNYSHKNIIRLEAPLLSYSATAIRELLDSGKNASHLMPKKSWELIQKNNWFIKY